MHQQQGALHTPALTACRPRWCRMLCCRYVLGWLAERKSLADLVASIRDGRWGAQRAGMARAAAGGLAGVRVERLLLLEGRPEDLLEPGEGAALRHCGTAAAEAQAAGRMRMRGAAAACGWRPLPC